MICFLDGDGEILSTNTSTGYPAPEDVMERLKRDIQFPNVRVVDIPPLDREFWYFGPDAEYPTVKPQVSVEINKTEVVANEVDAVVLSGLPDDAIVHCNGGSLDSEKSGTLSLKFRASGVHVVSVTKRGFRSQTFQITAVDQAGRKRALEPVESKNADITVVVGIEDAAYRVELENRVREHFDRISNNYSRSLILAPEASRVVNGEASNEMSKLASAANEDVNLYVAKILTDKVSYFTNEQKREHVLREIKTAFSQEGVSPRRADLEAVVQTFGVPPAQGR